MKMKKIITILLALILSLNLQVQFHNEILILAEGETETAQVKGTLAEQWSTKYGNLYLSITKDEATAAGFEIGDLVEVKFLDQSLILPYVTNYPNVDSGLPGLFALDGSDNLLLAINMGDFTTTYGIATKTTFEDKTYTWTLNEGVDENTEFTISMHQKKGYYDEYLMRSLSYTNERTDYPNLSDEQFANLRVVNTTGMGKHTLIRTASPIDNSRNRAPYADAGIKNYRATVMINLADSLETMNSFEGFENTYYATQKYIGLDMGVDFNAEDFRSKFAEGIAFMAENPGIYVIHCLEGKDRTGFVLAVLECLMGATYDEIVNDYMITFENYYGVENGSESYYRIAQNNIVKSLEKAFNVESLASANLAQEAEEYIKEIGVDDATIAKLKANLAEDNHKYVADSLGVPPTCTEPGYTPVLICEICGHIHSEAQQIEPLGHAWGEWIIKEEATNEKEGLKIRICAHDETHTETEVIPIQKEDKNEEPIVSPTPTQEPTPSPTPTPTPTVDTKGKPIVNTADPIMPFVGLFAISMISVLAISLKRRVD